MPTPTAAAAAAVVHDGRETDSEVERGSNKQKLEAIWLIR